MKGHSPHAVSSQATADPCDPSPELLDPRRSALRYPHDPTHLRPDHARGRGRIGDTGHGASRSSKLGAIGLQLYSVRGLMKEDLPGTLQKVAAIGFKEVEFAGLFERLRRMSARSSTRTA